VTGVQTCALPIFFTAVSAKKVDIFLPNVINPLEVITHTNREAQWCHSKTQFLLYFIHQIESIVSFSIEFVDENNHRDVSHTTNFNEFFGLLFYPFGNVYYYDYAIYGCKGTIGIFCKILVPRRIENIDFFSFIIECQNRCGYRNPSLSFDFHKVRSGSFFDFVALYSSCLLNRSSKKQQFFSKSRLSGIGVSNNPKGSSFFDFVYKTHSFLIKSAKISVLFGL